MRGEVVTLDGRSQVAVRARDLHAAMGVRTKFADWLDRAIQRHGLVADVDHREVTARGGRANRRDAVLTVEAASRVARERGMAGVVDAVDVPSPDGGDLDPAVSWSMPAVVAVPTSVGVVDGVDMERLHASLGVATRYSDWRRRRLAEYDLREGREVFTVLRNLPADASVPSRGALTFLTLQAAKELSMCESSAIGRVIRRHFIRCEERLRAEAPAAAAEEDGRLRAGLDGLRGGPGASEGPGGLAPGESPADPQPSEASPSLVDLLARLVEVPGMTPQLLGRVVDLHDGRAPVAPRAAPAEPVPGPRAAPEAPDGTRVDPATGASRQMPPSPLFRTSVGVVVDLSLSGRAASTASRQAALLHAGCRDVDRRTFSFWRRAYEGRGRPEGSRPQRGEHVVDGMALAMRREAVHAYLVIESERPAARERWLEAVKQARNRAIFEASWARVDKKVH